MSERLSRSAGLIGVATMASRVLGLVRDMVQTLWDEILLLVGRLTDLVRGSAPQLLRGPTEVPPPAEDPPSRAVR